ncbi:uncharacterized protein BDZ83DRAFT_459728 [Colletotrichum acutatum]|uniref:Uncharacterized protein n=1 Tax=Glomerella acutata TaxID=27357 RepID=A0AAD8XFG1_GLOAC|nr:uncharacterized protein BDZ83DRAFT_459728 [Colletotrichum acutatum]KAK1719516.1 hypothetical protein BDZ83DRAFT_459728 [Colletotrichum acutatum]
MMSTSKHCSKYCSNEWGVPDTSREVLKIGHLQGLLLLLCDDLAQKEMLPQSTERIVEVQGTPEGTKGAIWEICKCLVDDWQRGTGIVLYNPVIRIQFETTHIHSVGYLLPPTTISLRQVTQPRRFQEARQDHSRRGCCQGSK